MCDWELFPSAPEPSETANTIWTEIKSEPVQLGQNLIGAHKQLTDGPYKFRSKNPAAWYNLNEAAVEVRFCLKLFGTNNGLALASEPSALISGGYHLFSRAELALSGGELTEVVDYPGYVQTMLAAMRYSPSKLNQAADFEWLYPETINEKFGRTAAGGPPPVPNDALNLAGGSVLSTHLLGAAAPYNNISGTPSAARVSQQSKYNRSFQRRAMRLAADADGVSRVVSLMLPLRSVFSFADNIAHPIRGAPLELTLYKNLDYATILHTVGTNTETVILSMNLWLPQVMPAAKVSAQLERWISERASTNYVFDSRNVYISDEYASSATPRQIDWRVNAVNNKPKAIFVGFQHEAQFTLQADALAYDDPIDDVVDQRQVGANWSQYSVANGGIFSHLNDIYYVEARVANKAYPVQRYNMTFADESSTRAYLDTLAIFFKDNPENAKLMNYQTWKASPIFSFLIDDDSVFERVKSIELSIRARVLSGPEVGSFRMVVMVVTEQMLTRASDGAREIFST